MKRIGLLGLMIAAFALPAMLQAQVETSVGKISIGGKVKWMWMHQAQSDEALGASNSAAGHIGQRWGLDGKGVDQFTASNVELDIKGSVGENVAYIIELQASFNPTGGGFGGVLGGMAGVSNPGEVNGGKIGVRQAKIVITDLIPMTTVTLGTFSLPLGSYQTRATNDWGLISLPLMNLALFGNARAPKSAGPGRFYGPIGLGWQATGVDLCVKPADVVALHMAYFNGNSGSGPFGGGGGNTNADLDLEKSWLIKLEIMPVEGAQIGVAFLNEGWQEDVNGKGGNEQQYAQGWIINAGYKTDRLDLSFDWMAMTARDYVHGQGAWDHFQDLNWMALQVTAGIWVTDQIEVLARYDWVDPNTSNNKFRTSGAGPYSYLARNDALTIWTLGANFRVSENAELALNYLWIKEQGLPINQRRADKTSALGDKYGAGVVILNRAHGERQQLANDTFLLQVQVWQ
jgi:hypothetical protein